LAHLSQDRAAAVTADPDLTVILAVHGIWNDSCSAVVFSSEIISR